MRLIPLKSNVYKFIGATVLLGAFCLSGTGSAAADTVLALAESAEIEGKNVQMSKELLNFSGSYAEQYDRFYLLLNRRGPTVFPETSRYLVSAIAFAPGRTEQEMNFSWYSPDTRNPGVVEYAKAGSDAENAAVQTSIAHLDIASTGYASNEATITGLEPSTEYIYRLGDGFGNWSETYQFHTRETDAYNFLLMGDPQIGASGNLAADIAGWNETLEKAMDKYPMTSFIQSAGDQVESRNSEEEYEAYFEPDVLKRVPTATTIGNHDNTIFYEYHFNVPNQNAALGNYDSSGGNYYFTYGDALFINLNSNQTNGEEHVRFMEETIDATADQDFKWKFVVFHHSIYSAAVHSTSDHVMGLREQLVPTIDRLEIDAVLMGHDHSYVRTHQMKGFKPLKNHMVRDGALINPEGTIYLTGNSASGSKFYGMNTDPEPYSAMREQLELPTFMNVAVTPTSLEFTTYRTDTMEVVDTYKIVKDNSIQVEVPGLSSAALTATGTILPTEATEFYPKVVLDVAGTNTEGGQYDLFEENIVYRVQPEGAVAISQTGEVSLTENTGPGEVEIWAEVTTDRKKLTTEPVQLSIIDHEETTLLEAESDWTYLDDGTDPGSDWTEPGFDDSGWEQGASPLGYPEGDAREPFGEIQTVIGYGDEEFDKYATSYFRTSFTVDDADAIGNYGIIDFEADDGAIVYLNGEEIGRYNMADGEVDYDDHLNDLDRENIPPENKLTRITLDDDALTNLTDGENTIAVEVRQDNPQSSDVYWDMKFAVNLKTD